MAKTYWVANLTAPADLVAWSGMMQRLSEAPEDAGYHRTAEKRYLAGLLQTRANLLAGRDRAFLTMYVENGANFRQMARLARMSPTSVARKVRRIAARLTDETYPLCLRHRERFSGLELAIIRDHFVRGRSMTQISRERSLTYYRVRATVLKAQEFTISLRSRAIRGVMGTPTRDVRSMAMETNHGDIQRF